MMIRLFSLSAAAFMSLFLANAQAGELPSKDFNVTIKDCPKHALDAATAQLYMDAGSKAQWYELTGLKKTEFASGPNYEVLFEIRFPDGTSGGALKYAVSLYYQQGWNCIPTQIEKLK